VHCKRCLADSTFLIEYSDNHGKSFTETRFSVSLYFCISGKDRVSREKLNSICCIISVRHIFTLLGHAGTICV
jgi:hypothetical protein